MSSPKGQPVKREHMLRHSQRDVPKILKARFSPTAIWTTESEIVPTERTTAAEETTRAITTPVVHTITSAVTISTSSSKSVTPSSTSSIPTTTSNSSTSTTSSSLSSLSTIKTTSTAPTIASTSLVHTTTTPTVLSTTPQSTAFVTKTVSSSSHAVASAAGSALDSAASSTSSATATSGMSTAGIIGISAAGIAGAAVIAGIIVFFLRRWNRNEDEFNPADFRRQSIVLRDDNSSLHRGNSSNRGPRPPTMFERHNQTFATYVASPMPPTNAYHQAAPYGSPSPFSDFAASQPSPSFSPGMYIPNASASPASGQYENTPSFFSPSFQSPMGSPVTVNSYGGAAFEAQGRLVRGPSNAGTSLLSRSNSVAHPHYPAEESDYADLSRASVTPYQAAQYEAISRRLNIENPSGNTLQQITEADRADESHRASKQSLAAYATSAKPPIDVSPFDDQHESNGKGTETTHVDEDIMKPSRPSSEFHPMNSFTLPEDPSPRITSKPPSLPEIYMLHSTFSPVSYNFPMTPSPRKASFDVQSGRASPKVDLPPLSPTTTSPQRAQFVEGNESFAHNGRETPVEIGFVADGASAPTVAVQAPAQAHTQAVKRPDTVYDVEDAYGGF